MDAARPIQAALVSTDFIKILLTGRKCAALWIPLAAQLRRQV